MASLFLNWTGSDKQQDIAEDIHQILSADKSSLAWYKCSNDWIIVHKLGLISNNQTKILLPLDGKLTLQTVSTDTHQLCSRRTTVSSSDQIKTANTNIVRDLLNTIDLLYKTYHHKSKLINTLKSEKKDLESKVTKLQRQNKAADKKYKKELRAKMREKEQEIELEKTRNAQQGIDWKKKSNEFKNQIKEKNEELKRVRFGSPAPKGPIRNEEYIKGLEDKIITQDKQNNELKRRIKVVNVKNESLKQEVGLLQRVHEGIVEEYVVTKGGDGDDDRAPDLMDEEEKEDNEMYEAKEQDNVMRKERQYKSIFDEEIIYVLNVTIKKGINLGNGNNYVKIHTANKSYQTTIQNSSNPEWNQTFNFLCYESPKYISFQVNANTPSKQNVPIGQYTMSLDSDFFQQGHPGREEIVNLRNLQKGQIDVKVNGRIYEPFKVIQEFAALQAMDNDDQEINEAMTMEIMNKHNSEKQKINAKMNNLSDDKKKIPLHLFDIERIHDSIQHWILNDAKYTRDLLEMIRLFSNHSLSGKVVNLTSINNCKKIVYQDLIQFMEKKTIDIMFEEFQEYTEQNRNKLQSKSAPEIAYILFNHPSHRLLQKITTGSIDGKDFIERCQSDDRWMRTATGWNMEEIHQLTAILLQHVSMTKNEFMQNMKRTMIRDQTVSDKIKTKIEEKLMKFDLEQLYFNVKNNISIQEFSDSIIELVDDLNDDEKAISDEDIVPKIYSLIASLFVYQNINSNQLARAGKEWICGNCSTKNFCKFMDNMQMDDNTTCLLCGIDQQQSIIMRLRQYDTFTMINEHDDESEEKIMADHVNEIDKLVQQATNNQGFDLRCPARNDNQPCPAILGLAKQLIIYKRWLQLIYTNKDSNDNIDDTVQADLKNNIDNDNYKYALIQAIKSIKHKRCTDDIRQKIFKMIEENTENIAELDTFLKMKNKKEFAALIKKHTKLIPCLGARIHKITTALLKPIAHGNQFGKFITRNIHQIDDLYHHILKIHIKQGNASTIKNVFRFYGRVIHYEDADKKKKECRSVERRKQRCDRLKNTLKLSNSSSSRMNVTNNEDKEVFELQQNYAQGQLDMIHSYLCHIDWKDRVNRYYQQKKQQNSENKEEDDGEEEGIELEEVDVIVAIDDINKDKYISDSYGFGVDHSHPYLKPKYPSLHDELLLNTLHPIEERTFCQLLTKALQVHRIAITKYKEELIGKYYKREYNIIRNQKISLPHVMALIIYTDCSQFCTAFRQTYRKIDGETTTKQVEDRHKELYHFSRCLFEAVEFFGNPLESNMTVYHGLNKVLHFGQFTAYFNQPISTTSDITTAHQFSQSTGIILALRTSTNYKLNSSRSPKYLGVSWLSDYPNENEKLFYGLYVRFKINDIIEGHNLKQHGTELSAFNRFQSLLDNFKVDWNLDDESDQEMIQLLYELLKEKKDELEMKTENDYGRDLFDYFCKHKDRQDITIQNFTSLPVSLRAALFTDQEPDKLSFHAMANIFPCLTNLTLNELELSEFLGHIKEFVDAIQNFVQLQQLSKNANLSTITLESEKQQDRKINPVLQKYNGRLIGNDVKWRINYIYSPKDDGCYHSIVISKHISLSVEQQVAMTKEAIRSHSADQLLQLIDDICDKSDKLLNFKQEFLTFFKQKNVTGSMFALYDRKKFGQDVVNHFDNKKIRGPAQDLYTRISKVCVKAFTSLHGNDEKLQNDEIKQDLEDIHDEKQNIWHQVIDRDGKGRITRMEWLEMNERLNIETLTDNDLGEIFVQLDESNRGYIERQDFVSFAGKEFDESDSLLALQKSLMEGLKETASKSN